MLGFGAVSSMLSAKFKERMMSVAALVIVLVGLVMLNRGAMLVGSPVTFDSAKAYVLGTDASAAQSFQTGKDGVAEVKLSIINTQFVPSTVSIPADRPVRLIVDRKEAVACSAQLAVPQLGVLANLKDNAVTTVDLPSAKGGTYTLTCGMGMMSGRLSVGGGAGAGSRGPVLSLLALLAVAGGFLVYRRRASRNGEVPAGATGAKGRGTSVPAPEAAPATVLGFSPPEVLVLGGALTAAVVAGLALGGFFR
jgi:hypothetical protein